MLTLARLGRLGLAVGTAAVVAVGLSTNAQAATGALRYFSISGQEFRITNPPNNVCINLQVQPDLIANQTDKTMSVFSGANCTSFVLNLDPGRSVAHIGGPRSVLFIG
ncbi:hypothetical protein [Streptomyces sp. MBT62]|uniref:hypothetical protein n=1 Tax=Streptomyces sp. MBT62 TaxID=2800410 RepID=UPI00190A2F5F|nr:hypothetical protein [Streptomyces sp. MBT62]MBK3568246.1 hypothetical protein [Streptomyces sp. MBT62]